MKHPQCSRRQRGAAMVEFIVGAVFVLVPMYLAVQALGKFADVQHTTNSAARYAAWEKTVWFEDTSSKFHEHNRPNQKTGAQIRNEMLVRIFNDRRDNLRYSNADKGATTFANGTDPLWHDTDDLVFMDDPSGVTQASARATPSRDFVGAILGAFNNLPIPEIVGNIAPPVPGDTLVTTAVKLDKVAAKSDVYKRLWSKAQSLPEDWAGLNFEGHSGVLSNSWGANSRTGTKAMVAESVPTANVLGTVVETGALVTMGLWDPLLVVPVPRLQMGKIATDVVPDDRLK